MTRTATTSRASYVADGLATPRNVGFPLESATDLIVKVNGILQTLNLHYSINGSLSNPVMTPLSPFWANGATVRYKRKTPAKQEYDAQAGVALQAESLEAALDRNAMVAQDLSGDMAELEARAIRVPEGENAAELPPLASRAGKVAAFDGLGNIIAFLGLLAGVPAIAANIATDGGVYDVQEYLNGLPVNARMFGASPAASAATNLAAIQTAINATPTGGTLVIPGNVTGDYLIDTSGGLTSALLVNRAMTIIIEGHLKMTTGDQELNPPYLFKATANDVQFIVNGSLKGDGTINDANAGDESDFPGLVYVTGKRFKFKGNIDTPPKVGILLYGAEDAEIDLHAKGGPIAYTVGNTAYFAARSTGGGRHDIKVTATRDAGGCRFVSAVFIGGLLGGSPRSVVRDSFADVHEKLVYGISDRVIVRNSYVVDAVQTDVIRLQGSYNKAINNDGDNVKGGVTLYDGHHNEVRNNTFRGVKQIGIYVGRLSVGYAGGFTGTKIIGNTIEGDGASLLLQDGVMLDLDGADSNDIRVKNNNISNFALTAGQALIRVKMGAGFAIRNATISNNDLADTTLDGIITDRVINSVVQGNTGRNIGGWMLKEIGGANNRWLQNSGEGIGNIGISGLDASSEGHGNRYNTTPLNGIAVLAAAITTTIAHGGVAANAQIYIAPVSASFGVLTVVKGYPMTPRNGTGFDVIMANGTAAAGGEQFQYMIDQ